MKKFLAFLALGLATFVVAEDLVLNPYGQQVVTIEKAGKTQPVVTRRSEVLTAARTLSAADNNSIFYLNSATEFAVTLPAVALDAEYTFIVKAAPSGASYTVVAAGSGAANDIIIGSAVNAAGVAGDTGTADDTISFVDGQAVAGDVVRVRSDGTKWYATAQSAVAAGITFTDVD
jgi:hypothetical protein